MRHLVEVVLVLEGKEPWAKEIKDRRSSSEEEGGGGGEGGLPIPTITFHIFDDDGGGGSSGGGGGSNAALAKLLRVMTEEIDKVLLRMIVSFI